MNYVKHLMKDKRFLPAFWTQFWGAFNDNVFKNALIILITYKSFSISSFSSEQMVALCGGIFIVPFFVFSAFAGQIADKFSKNKLMFWIKCLEVVVMIFGSIGFLSENIYLLMMSLFLMGLQSTFFGPVKFSILPELINDDELIQGNALIEMGTFLSILIGTIVGGLIISIPDTGKMYVSITVIILALVGTFFSKKVQNLSPVNPELKLEIGFFRPTFNILKIGKKEKSVWLSILGISWFWFLGAVLLSIFPVYVKDVLSGTQEVVTLLLALFSIGVAIGSMLCEKLSKERLELGLVPVGSIGMSIFIIDLFFVGMLDSSGLNEVITVSKFISYAISYRIMFDILMFSIFSGLFIVPLYTLIQQRSDDSVRSRIIACNNIMNALFMVIGSLVLTYFYSLDYAIPTLFLIFGGINAIVSLYIYRILPEFLLRFCAMVLTRIIYRVQAKRLVNIPEEGAAILVCNHVSFVDWLVIAATIKRPVRFVMHYSFMKIPLVRLLFIGAKVIPIAGYRECNDTLNKAYDQISKALEDGELVCIFPEGKITKDGSLNEYKKGIENILDRNPVPVVPMVLKGLWGSFFSRKYGKAASRPLIILKTIKSRVCLDIGEVLDPNGLKASDLYTISCNMLDQSVASKDYD
ncbi:MFS transporter [Halobacteriovorax sp. HLS]|uniref:MFS transporter n=1 Tax=Halobacteriovorax sp. HLS TaxID=2234000 RepID=UPI000FDA5B0D|nr:MFS transporter [Halobacteriovorax sp. HLS]